MAASSLSVLDEVRRIIDEPGLTALGYEVQVGLSVNSRRANVTLRHPLRGNSDWGWMSLDLEPASLEQLAVKVNKWPDIQVTRLAGSVRPEVVPVLGALRHAEIMALLLHRHRRFRAGFNAAVAAIRNVAFSLQEAAGILNDEEVDWLVKAFESDREELWVNRGAGERSAPKGGGIID